VPVVGLLHGACVCRLWALGGGLGGLSALTSDESALEVCTHDDTLYKSTFLTSLISFFQFSLEPHKVV